MRVVAAYRCLAIFLVLFTGSKSLYATESPARYAFSDPNHVASPGKDFIDKPVVYEPRAGDADVVISLGQQTYPALHEIVTQLARELDISVDIQQGSCGATAKKLLKKSVDIGTYCCPPGKIDRLPGLKFNTIAISPLALTTNGENPLNDVSFEDARKIFRGEHLLWSEVPGSKTGADPLTGKIQPVVRLHCKKRPGHWRLLLDNQDEFSPRSRAVGTIPDMIKQVSDNSTAIGYETLFMLMKNRDMGKLKVLSIDGIHPDNLDKLVSTKYPLYRTYNMTSWTQQNNRNEKAEQLLAAIKQHVEQHGNKYDFVPASELRKAGWKFKGEELVGEPDGATLFSENR